MNGNESLTLKIAPKFRLWALAGPLPRLGRNLCASGVNLFLTLLCMQFCVLYITAFSCRFRLLLSDNMHATKHSFCNADSSGVLPVADHMVL